jgi:hypothetical protein
VADAESIREHVKEEARSYAAGEERPLGSFVALMAAYATVVGGLFGSVRISKRSLPETVGWADLVLATIATHKISRLLSKDPVTSPLRAPFTRFAGTTGEAELAEDVRGRGPRKAIGELVTCPFCLGLWVATGLAFALVLAPRPTRLVVAIFTSLTGADFLQFAYDKVQG